MNNLNHSPSEAGPNAFFSSGYVRPQRLVDALAARSVSDALVVAGGTDVYPAHVGKPLPMSLIDVSSVEEMRSLVVTPGEIRFGGAMTWTDIVAAELPPALSALQDAARQIGSLQIQNRATLAGNLCNASPAADGVPPLLVLDAEVELASSSGIRRMKLEKFIVGYRKTALREDEILTAVILPTPRPDARSAFVKLGARKYLVISIVMAAALVTRGPLGEIAEARIAVGSASAKALRLEALERDLHGLASGQAPSSILRASHFAGLSPIDDVRADARYRLAAAQQLVGMAIDHAAESQR